MGTKTKDTQTNQYNPAQMAATNQMTGPMASAATGYMQNPFGNPFFQAQQQMGTRQAQNLGGTQMSNIANNMRASGIGGGGAAPFQQEMMQNQGRANTGMQAQLGFLNPVQNALQLQQNSMGLAAGFKPLQTGQTDVKQTSGLGTWLPQVVGGALGMMNPLSQLGGMGGGLAGAGMGAARAAGGAFGAPSPGYGGSGMPGQSFPNMFAGYNPQPQGGQGPFGYGGTPPFQGAGGSAPWYGGGQGY